MQNEDPSYAGGANVVSLEDARRNFIALGAAEARCLAYVRGPRVEEVPPPFILLGLDSELCVEKRRATKIALIGTLRSVRSGLIPLLSGCVAISSLGRPLETEGTLEEYLLLFNGVASEVDEFPTGDARKHWSADAIAERDAQLDEFERKVRSDVMNACERLETALVAELKG